MPSLECCICTDVLLKEELTISSTPCGHVYHSQCIFDWIIKCENGANCPVCRRTFQLSEVAPINAATDEDITAIAKAISEQVPVERPENQALQEFRNIQPFAPTVPLPLFQPLHPIMPYIQNSLLPRVINESDSSSNDEPDSFDDEPFYDSDHSDHSEILLDIEPTDDECDDFNDPDDVIGSHPDFINDSNDDQVDLTEESDDNQSVGSANNDHFMSDHAESEHNVDFNDDYDDAENEQQNAGDIHDDHESIDNDDIIDDNEDVENDVDTDSNSDVYDFVEDYFDDGSDDFQNDWADLADADYWDD